LSQTISDDDLDAVLSGEQSGVRHRFFTRAGGVSRGLYDSLNCGAGSQDDSEHVAENRAIVARGMGAAPESLMTVYQCHTALVEVVEKPWSRQDAPVADAMVTARPGLVLGVLTADCAPVLFADLEGRVVGAAHAGWRGASGGVIEATIEAMERLGARRERLHAIVGPAISQEAYEVGGDFQKAVVETDPEAARCFAQAEGQPKPFFDLPGYVMSRLERAGVAHRRSVNLCTRSRESMFFSYRRSQMRKEADYGRQISAILIL
jgi:polyphenol oxidase